MNRLLPLLGLMALGCVAFGMYQLAYEVKRLEDELITHNRAIMREREMIDIYSAEWSYLSRPDRLQAQAGRNLALVPVALHRLVAIADLPARPEGAVVEGWGVITVPDPNAPPAPLGKPLPELAPLPPAGIGALAVMTRPLPADGAAAAPIGASR